MCFVLIWLYYMTGIRVSEGLALNWNDVDFKRKKAKNSSYSGNGESKKISYESPIQN